MVDLDFRFGGEMRSHRLPITLTGVQRRPAGCHRRRFRLPRGCSVRLAHLMGMNTTELGLEPLIGVEELAEYLGVPLQTIYDWAAVRTGAASLQARQAPAVRGQRHRGMAEGAARGRLP